MGETIRYTTGACSLGFILVAASDKGVCAISIGDDSEGLADNFTRRFPGAKTGNDKELCGWLEKVTAFVESPKNGLELPLDIRGTDFQKRVWTALQKIPCGATASYAEVARKIGAPKAARAAATACAANPLPLVIPCHRVIHKGGSLSGYGCGVERKRILLAREANRVVPRSH
jgi:AraC family transcriptional regulator, regulatory protein of adaptative response / methylated-DNA-[protein]-cysteine methyltransferase